MSWLSKLIERRSTNQAQGGDSYWQDYQAARHGPVNVNTAQGISAVYACVAAISETVASLPLHLFKGEEKARNHPLYRVLQEQSNPEQIALEFRELMTAQTLLTGNAFARIERDNSGQVIALWPLSDVQVVRLKSGALAYEYTNSKNGEFVRLLAHEVLHLRHRIGPDGVLGLSPISVARGVIELAQAEQTHGLETFRNGAKLAGILEAPGALKAEQRLAIRDAWSQHRTGSTPVVDGGIKYNPISQTLEDAEWIAARQFSVEEVARIFRVPPTLIGDLRNGNYSNTMELNRQFVTLTLRRWLLMWEQGIYSKCLTEAGRRTYYAEHSVEGLLRGDSTTRAAFYSSGIASGWMRPSEARALENLPAIEGIDKPKGEIPNPTPAPQPYPSKQVPA